MQNRPSSPTNPPREPTLSPSVDCSCKSEHNSHTGPEMQAKHPEDLPGAPIVPLEGFTPDKLPDPWLVDSAYLMHELARIRSLAVAVPLTLEAYGPTNTIVDALWRLEQQLRFLLCLHREGQRSFAQKSEQISSPKKRTKKRSAEAESGLLRIVK